MPLKYLNRLGGIALLLAWCFDQLFWQKAPGVNFLIFVVLCLLGGALLTLAEGKRPAGASLPLLLLPLFFAAMTFFRLETFSQAIDVALTLGCMALLAITWLGGRWWQYGLRDYLVNGLRLLGGVFARPLSAFSRRSAGHDGDDAGRASWRRYRALLSILAGLLLAFPVIALLSVLLAEADPIFERGLTQLLQLLRIENIAEYIVRLTYISIGAYLLAGVLLFALLSSPEENLADAASPVIPPFLGWVEAGTVLACMDVLFGVFVALQFRYFFGGQANIRVEGFTYAEYARRGFGELVAVAFISLLVFLSLSAVTRRDAPLPRRIFSALGIGLLGFVAVILVSAFQRLQLYELAYGFSRIRTYTHVFMVWLGILLAATVLLEAAGQTRRFALALVLAGLGFGATINLVNVDAFIARANLQRAALGLPLDVNYLASMTDDAAPVLYASLQDEQLPAAVRGQLGAMLACQVARQSAREAARSVPQPWQSAHASHLQARRLQVQYQALLDTYPVRRSGSGWLVTLDGRETPCVSPQTFID